MQFLWQGYANELRKTEDVISMPDESKEVMRREGTKARRSKKTKRILRLIE
jgi:hypothetical protein